MKLHPNIWSRKRKTEVTTSPEEAEEAVVEVVTEVAIEVAKAEVEAITKVQEVPEKKVEMKEALDHKLNELDMKGEEGKTKSIKIDTWFTDFGGRWGSDTL